MIRISENDRSIISLLYLKSKAGKIKWKIRGSTKDSFYASFKGGFIMLSTMGPSNYLKYRLSIANQDGIIVRKIDQGSNDELFRELKYIYDKAMNDEIGVEDTINELLKDLKSKDFLGNDEGD